MDSTPVKHIKIDDEERASDEDHMYSVSGSCWSLLRGIGMIPLLIFLTLLVIALLAYAIYKPPLFIIEFLQWKNPDVLFHVPLPKSQRVVALSIDDAPSGETAKILDLLKAYSAKSTFFVIGNQISAYPELLKRMRDEGHEIGNHAWADEPSVKLPLPELERQVKDVERLILANSQSPDGDTAPGGAEDHVSVPRYFRPGSGFFSTKMVRKVKSLGYRVVLGSIYPHDPQIHSPRLNSGHVLSMVRPGGIIIMHDRRPYSAQQLEMVLRGLDAGGWAVESIGGLLRAAERIGSDN